jgi:4-hydroxyphenylpyruvate dioxygenase
MPNRSAIASMSLGRAWVHDLPGKLRQAARYGFEGIEMFYEDLEYFANAGAFDPLEAAGQIRQLCDSLHLDIVCLQPFLFYEGLLDRTEHDRLVNEKLPLWFKIAHILGTDIIQVPSNFLGPDPVTGEPRTTGDMDVIVGDLREIADLAVQQSPPIRFAYESLAWGNHINTWEMCWEVIMRVDRPNFGACLDTFNIAGRVYADPASPSGKTPNADIDMQASVRRLIKTVDARKVFFVQIVDGERLSAPLVVGHPFYVEGQPSRMNWSRNARLFAFEESRGGYLPILEIARAFFDIGFEGWVSMELFSRTLADLDPRTPEQHAKRGMESYKKLVQMLRLDRIDPIRQHL